MERTFAVWPDMAAGLGAADLPLYSLESTRPLRAFDIIGFSLGYEQTFTNVLECLDLAGLAVCAADRTPEDPLVIAGGTCALNPEPMAKFIDLFVLGEAEEVIIELFDLYRAHRTEHPGPDWKKSFLRRAAKLRGIYVPTLYDVTYNPDGTLKDIWARYPEAPKTVERRMVKRMPPYPLKPIVPYVELIHDRVGIELFRGCTRGCRYCQAGMIYRPVRERTKDEVLAMAETLFRNTGYEQLSLVSLASGDYSALAPLIEELVARYGDKGLNISLPSLRIDSFSVDITEAISGQRKGSFTFAPEAGTQRLRDVINKGVTEEDLYNTAELVFSRGWTTIKLYFMV